MRINLRPVWEKLVPDRWLCFCPIFLSFCWSSLVTFGEFTFQKLVANQLFRLEFCAVRQHTFYTRQVYEQVNLYKTSNLYFIGWSIRNWKIAAYLQYANNWNTSSKVWQNLLSLSTFWTSLRCYAKENWKSRVCARSKLWIFWFVTKQRHKVLAAFRQLLWRECNSKAFVDIATAGRHRGLSTIYMKHNVFHQIKLGRDVESQNTHIVLFKTPRDVMQITTLITQLGLASELIDWYRDATSVPFAHLLIDLSPRTDDRLQYCANTGSIPSKFYIPYRLKQSIFLDDEHTKSLYSSSVLIFFPQMQKSFPSVLSKSVYPFSLRIPKKSTQRKPAKHKKTSHGRISKRGSTFSFKTYNVEAKKRYSGVRKSLTAHLGYYTSSH